MEHQDKEWNNKIVANNYNYLKELLVPVKSKSLTKLRYGSFNDGGYVFAKELVDACDSVYSYGIGTHPEGVDFDLQMANLGKKVYMRDGSVDAPPVAHENFVFEKVFVDAKNFGEHLVSNNHHLSTNLIGQIDIEGAEWQTFLGCPQDCFLRFSQFSVEFHDFLMENPWNIPSQIDFKDKMTKKNLCIWRILQTHHIYHIHGNNHSYNGEVPNVMEITFIRKDVVDDFEPETQSFPIPFLDSPCNPDRQDYKLDWWIK